VFDGVVQNMFSTHNTQLTLDIANEHAPSDDMYMPDYDHLTGRTHKGVGDFTEPTTPLT
jgi:hypothetical protein